MYTVRNNTIHFEVKKHMNEQKNSTKTQIKQATIRQIEKFGIDKTSMRSIAAEANMTTGAIYYYYKNKQDLFDEIVTDSIHFAHRIFHENENEKITIDSLFSNVEKEARIRFKRLQEEKLYLLLLSDAMKCDSEFSQKYTSGLKSILDQAATLFASAFALDDRSLQNNSLLSLWLHLMDSRFNRYFMRFQKMILLMQIRYLTSSQPAFRIILRNIESLDRSSKADTGNESCTGFIFFYPFLFHDKN